MLGCGCGRGGGGERRGGDAAGGAGVGFSLEIGQLGGLGGREMGMGMQRYRLWCAFSLQLSPFLDGGRLLRTAPVGWNGLRGSFADSELKSNVGLGLFGAS